MAVKNSQRKHRVCDSNWSDGQTFSSLIIGKHLCSILTLASFLSKFLLDLWLFSCTNKQTRASIMGKYMSELSSNHGELPNIFGLVFAYIKKKLFFHTHRLLCKRAVIVSSARIS